MPEAYDASDIHTMRIMMTTMVPRKPRLYEAVRGCMRLYEAVRGCTRVLKVDPA